MPLLYREEDSSTSLFGPERRNSPVWQKSALTTKPSRLKIKYFSFGTDLASSCVLAGGFMSKELWSAVKGSGVGATIGFAFGIATLSTIGFERMTLFEGSLLLSCSIFGGVLFGALIGSTGAFRKEPALEAGRQRVVRGAA
jgi:hypothetical protein